MNDEHYPADFESLEQPLDAAVKAALAEPIPEDAIERVKTRAKQLAVAVALPSRASDSHKRGWRASRLIVAGLTTAAVLLLMVMGGFLLLNYSVGQVFAQMIENVKAASSVHFTTVTRFGRQPEIGGAMYLEGNRLRFEQMDGLLITVGDFDRKRALFLDTHRKLAQANEIDADVAREFANPIDQLRHATSNDAERIGEEILKGRRTQVYRLRKMDLFGMKGNAEMLVWVDVESEFQRRS